MPGFTSVNYTHFPIRRIDIQLNVGYKADIAVVREHLRDLASQHPLCLEEPQPTFVFQNLGDTALNLQFSVWVTRENYLQLKNELLENNKQPRGKPRGIAKALPGNLTIAIATILFTWQATGNCTLRD